jgi:signal transduction histidine kinase
LLAIFLLTAPRNWGAILLAVLPAHLLIQLKTGIPLFTALGWFAGNTGEALLGAACIRRLRKNKPLFESIQGVVIFLVFGVLLAPLVTSFIDAVSAIRIGPGRDYWILWTTRLTTNMVSILAIVPIIVLFASKGISWLRRANLARYFEAVILAFGVVTVSILVFSRATALDSLQSSFVYVPLLLLFWAAMRFGVGGLSASMLTVALISGWNAMHGRGPFEVASITGRVLPLHILLTVFAVPLMFAAALLTEQHSGQKVLASTRGKLISAYEQCCHRLGRHLHTEIAGRLTLVGLTIDHLRKGSDISDKTALDELRHEVCHVLKDTLDLAHQVHPFKVEYLGLPNALKNLCRDIGAQTGAVITFCGEHKSLALSSDVSRRLFLMAREALNNLIQHSHAKAATVELNICSGQVLLRIASNEADMSRLPSDEGAKITWIREQALSLGGSFKLKSCEPTGILFEVCLPMNPQSA